MDKRTTGKFEKNLLKNEPYDPAKNVQAIFDPAPSTELHSAGDTSSPNLPLDKQMI